MNKYGHVLNGVLLALGLALVLGAELSLTTVEWGVRLLPPVVLGALFPDVDTAFGKHRKTLHNLPVLALFVAYPLYFDNLHFVWVGIATHYLLDVVGSKRGIALFYPYTQEYGLPIGVAVSSEYSTVVTVVISVLEVGLLAAIHVYVIDLVATTVRPEFLALLPEVVRGLLRTAGLA
ncbi:metal-dependent hydrolase [Halobaculum sp. MBLA0147]|uniref:metal-dependent hydrolase n=1 Tax=Halobaculum sp. MBLA0147 TaxID=3079934 RepID=UPI003525F697